MSAIKSPASLPTLTLAGALAIAAFAGNASAQVEGRLIYWGQPGKLFRGCLDGAATEEVGLASGRAPALEVDRDAAKLYWLDNIGKFIFRSNLDGSDQETIYAALADADLTDLALDVPMGELYWSDDNADKIYKATLDGNNIETVKNVSSVQSLDIDLSSNPRRLFWSRAGTEPKIQRAFVQEEGVSNVQTIVEIGFTLPRGVLIDEVGQKIYWTEIGAVHRADLNGANVEDLNDWTGLRPYQLAFDELSQQLFVTEEIEENIYSIAVDVGGFPMTPVVDLQNNQDPAGIAFAIVPLEIDTLDAADAAPWGQNLGDRFGFQTRFAGRLSLSANSDIIVGQPRYDLKRGRITVVSGDDITGDFNGVACGDASVVFCREGAADGDQFGFAVAGAGKFDGNLVFEDAIVGAPGDDTGGANAGAIYIYAGAAPNALVLADTGRAPGDQFGYAVDGLGDVDLDGNDDVIVGAPFNDTGAENAGQAYVLRGNTGAVWATQTGESLGDQFGRVVAAAGDVDNDGQPDYIVTAPFNDEGGQNSGKAYVYSGADGSLLFSVVGGSGDRLGWSATSLGDLNGDGNDDIAVGAPRANGNGNDSGSALVISGADGSVMHELNGEAAGDNFGWQVVGMRDWDEDDIRELLVSSPRNDGGGPNAGRIYIFSGVTAELLAFMDGQKAGNQFGTSIDADLRPLPTLDILSSSWRFKSNGVNKRGRIYRYDLTQFGQACGD